jgi:hypothetical protein
MHPELRKPWLWLGSLIPHSCQLILVTLRHGIVRIPSTNELMQRLERCFDFLLNVGQIATDGSGTGMRHSLTAQSRADGCFQIVG